MRKIALSCLFLFLLVSVNNAQDYKTGIGIRGGYFNGLTFRHFINPTSAWEAIVDTRWRGTQIIGLYEGYNPAFNTERMKWYVGVGAHVGFWNGKYPYWGVDGKHYTVGGVDGIFGFEYNFTKVPISLGFDWKPELNFIGYTGYWDNGGACAVRYTY